MKMTIEKQKEFINNPKYIDPLIFGLLRMRQNHNANLNVILLPPGNLITKALQDKDFNVGYSTYESLLRLANNFDYDFHQRNKVRIDNGAIVVIFLDGEPNTFGTKKINSTDMYCCELKKNN